MRRHRCVSVLALLGLLLGGLLAPAPRARALGGWTPVAPPPALPEGGLTRRDTATTLADGRVLVTSLLFPNGVAAIYDPASDRWQAAAPFDPNNGRATPTLLADGRVLFVGGVSTRGISPSSMVGIGNAQLYDPATDTWTPVAPLRVARRDHAATPLPDGSVLVISGDSGPPFYSPRPTASVERYDPRTGTWSEVAPLPRARFAHGAALLADGRVLVAGGYGEAGAVVYDPAGDRWSAVADLPARAGLRWQARALTNGRVLAVGLGDEYTSSVAAVYDPAADRWSPTPPSPAFIGSVTFLPDGRALATAPATALYDPASATWAGAPPPADPAARTAALLRDGRVLLVGARGAEVYGDAPEPRACFAETGRCVSGRFLAYWEAHGGLARNGFPLSEVRVEVLEDGRAYQVQYFERVRLEYHPAHAGTPYEVLLGHFGRRVLLATTGRQVEPPAQPIPGQAYFQETGHNLGDGFRDYWVSNGGLMQFGYPISEVFEQELEDGKLYRVQYFERARFEYHPENPAPYDILLGHFGRRILAEAGR